MFIFDENTQPIMMDSIFDPTVTEYFWVLDLEMLDYTLTPLSVLEKVTCPSVQLNVLGSSFFLPASWNILVFDEETGHTDVVPLANAAGENFTAVVNGPNCNMIKPGPITIIDYTPSADNISPSLNKHQMLCHPVSPDLWINVAPSDAYNKYLKDLTVGELL